MSSIIPILVTFLFFHVYTEGNEFEQGDLLFKDLVAPLHLNENGLILAAVVESQLQVGQVFYELPVEGLENIPFFKARLFGRALKKGSSPFLTYQYDSDTFHVYGTPITNRIRYYRKWVSVGEDDEVSKKISGVKWPVCLGPQAFIDRIKEKYGSGKINKEIPSSRELLPGKKRIIDDVCRFYSVKTSELIKKQRGKRNEARNVAIYLTRKLRLDTYKEIGEQYGIDNDRTVRSVFVRMKKT